MKILSVVFLILLGLKLAQVGLMATASWWWVFSPLILLTVGKIAVWVVITVAVVGVFPAFSRWVVKSTR
ncbi:hypothetical protein RB16p033 [Escherichia phage RB16]|uniref:Conserved hypothetical phage protein n=1 Tax=Escherichia phage RB16 TaxID=2681599 RepID=D9IC94_BPRB1|nr:hypothetical protein RB16p033 [Escherichia phage RB16]ADJ55337.1 conserved hypothetical phage protein [Escherichia phage RB16]